MRFGDQPEVAGFGILRREGDTLVQEAPTPGQVRETGGWPPRMPGSHHLDRSLVRAKSCRWGLPARAETEELRVGRFQERRVVDRQMIRESELSEGVHPPGGLRAQKAAEVSLRRRGRLLSLEGPHGDPATCHRQEGPSTQPGTSLREEDRPPGVRRKPRATHALPRTSARASSRREDTPRYSFPTVPVCARRLRVSYPLRRIEPWIPW